MSLLGSNLSFAYVPGHYVLSEITVEVERGETERRRIPVFCCGKGGVHERFRSPARTALELEVFPDHLDVFQGLENVSGEDHVPHHSPIFPFTIS